MSKQILKELPDLVHAEVIDEATAQRIRAYYLQQSAQSSNRLFIVFGILGALLVGMGIVLIVAHNWDSLPKRIKLAIGFLPLLIGQVTAAYVIIRKMEEKAWKEGTGVFLFFAIAISISIISQVYHIEGDLDGFLFIWMCLALPIVYVLRSAVTSMLYVIGITWYACEVGYLENSDRYALAYWILLALILPFFYLEYLQTSLKNNFYYLLSWLLAASVTICLGVFVDDSEMTIVIAYMSLFSAFVIMSRMRLFETNRVLTNAFLVIGSFGIITLLLMLSFDWFWDELKQREVIFGQPEITVAAILTMLASYLLFQLLKHHQWNTINTKSYAFIVFIPLFFVGTELPVLAQLITNLLILLFAIYTIRDGAQRNHLGILNYGLMIITGLIFCRFFDTDFSFVFRGLLFIGVGIGFFAANYYMIQKRKKQA
ncbi:DUF2157 domain-containing protein [Chryseolinea sp. H1M3-3]|uniref:DUF2157 domain-containing protein n=1 Tax=Chryseolinea sp. H1M3-3 TaxID=3034144 RepID=UPI0023EC74F2|nr:DUF2157 domain-containing protein [Chryseolinea sp. H1M3-3]